MKKVIDVKDLGKQYRLGYVGSSTMVDDFKRFLARVQGKEDPFKKVGEVNQRDSKGDSNYVWALRNVSFEVEQGEVLGIIGKNGAGKSTLLKLLSKITTPTEGEIKMKGRVGSLLEVGTGFHPELTGRENIYLNGAILGMNKPEINRKLDEIISFSGVERYVDTPVKRYSSGMLVRLGFAVAAHLEPEILIVDEVLAVGDIEFQRKCIGKMQEVSGGGRTILFVSHNMSAVKSLCTRAVVLKNGEINFRGTAEEAVESYIAHEAMNTATKKQWELAEAPGNEFAKVKEISINDGQEGLYCYDPLKFRVVINLPEYVEKRVDVGLEIRDESDRPVFGLSSGSLEQGMTGNFPGDYVFTFELESWLNEGVYFVLLRVNENRGSRAKLRIDEIMSFEILSDKSGIVYSKMRGVVIPPYSVRFEKA